MSERSEYATMGFEPLYDTRFHVNMVGQHRGTVGPSFPADLYL